MVALDLRFMDDGAGLAHGRFEGFAIDFGDDLSGRDPITGIDVETLDDTAHLGAHLDKVLGLDGTRGDDNALDCGAFDCGGRADGLFAPAPADDCDNGDCQGRNRNPNG